MFVLMLVHEATRAITLDNVVSRRKIVLKPSVPR
jgi:hypothetical protein